MSVNEHTGAALRTKPASKEFRNNWDNIQWGNPLPSQEVIDSPSTILPNNLTVDEAREFICSGAKQPLSYESELCAQGTLAHNDAQYLARSRAVISEFWSDMPLMWQKLDELEYQYKGNMNGE